jgi:hypothetical protein
MTPEQLVEIEQIKQLKARYFRLMDTKQWPEWTQVFTEDAVLQWGPNEDNVFQGRDAIVNGVSHVLREATTCHHGHMPEIEIEGADRARGIWAMYDYVESPQFVLNGYGHYHEQYRKQGGSWRIHRLQLTRLREDRQMK